MKIRCWVSFLES